jgi:hypothetical protein
VVGLNRSDRVQEAGAAEGIQAAVFIVPLPVGRGTRLKIFDALAMGKRWSRPRSASRASQ